MRLVEKKCPNCKAALKFNDGDTVITCEYCGSTYHIEKNEKKSAMVDEEHFADAFRFVNEVGKPIVKGFTMIHTVMMIVPVVIFFIIAIIIGTNVFDQMEHKERNVFTTTQMDNEKKYVTKISQIDNVTLETFNDASLESLQSLDGSCTMGNYEISKNWTHIGVYLLVSKDEDDNILYDIFEHTYKNKKTGVETTLYGAIKFDSLALSDDGIVQNDYFGWAEVPRYEFEGTSFNGAYGYESVEKLYNKLIRSQSGEYKIEASKGLYIED